MKAKLSTPDAHFAREIHNPHAVVKRAVSVPEPARISIDTVKRPKNFRPIRKKTVRRLVVSIDAIGLQNPIAVRSKGDGTVVLVAGGHRLAACKQLGLSHISARILDAATSKIWNASENKDRAELTRLEQDLDIVAMAKALKHQNQKCGGAQPHDKGNSRVARAMNITTKEVRQAKLRIGICPKAITLAKQNGLDNNAAALNRIAAALNPIDELRVTKAIINEQKIRKNVARKKGKSARTNKLNSFTELKSAWLASSFRSRLLSANHSVRRRFVNEVIKKEISEQ